jgi:hypothetical protein
MAREASRLDGLAGDSMLYMADDNLPQMRRIDVPVLNLDRVAAIIAVRIPGSGRTAPEGRSGARTTAAVEDAGLGK